MAERKCVVTINERQFASAMGVRAGGWYRCTRDAGHSGQHTFTGRGGPFEVLGREGTA